MTKSERQELLAIIRLLRSDRLEQVAAGERRLLHMANYSSMSCACYQADGSLRPGHWDVHPDCTAHSLLASKLKKVHCACSAARMTCKACLGTGLRDVPSSARKLIQAANL